MQYFFILLLPYLALAKGEIEDARRSVKSLIQPLLVSSSKERPKGTEDIRVDGCEKKKIDWMGIIMMKESAALNFKFKEGCDIEGTIMPKMFQVFPAELKLRNIQSYSKINSLNKVTASFEKKPILSLQMTEGMLSGKEAKVKFEADYAVQMTATGEKVVQKNLGGELRILEINGKKVLIKEKILVE